MYGMKETEHYSGGKESVIIRNYLDGIKKGVVLDTSDFTEDYVQCGHVIIRKEGNYKPMPVNEEKYGTLPEGYSYVGVSMTTAPKDEAHVGVLTAGEVNDKAVPYPVDEILTAFKAAVPTIRWEHD